MKPDDIPQDVFHAALSATDSPFPGDIERIARAIMAEREACARIADEREAICADAVSKVDTGNLYAGNPTAKATEECARLEAAHIARLIRRNPSAIRNRSNQPVHG